MTTMFFRCRGHRFRLTVEDVTGIQAWVLEHAGRYSATEFHRAARHCRTAVPVNEESLTILLTAATTW